jgi:hypothetical protein
MLLVHTSEVSVNFTDFPLSVRVAPESTYSLCTSTTLVINADERDDGASPQRLNFTCGTEDMKRILREALDMLEAS